MNYVIKRKRENRCGVSFGEEGREEISEPEKHSRKVNFCGNVANIFSDILEHFDLEVTLLNYIVVSLLFALNLKVCVWMNVDFFY